ncbi:MAG TPA: bacillithiol biosynthesis cysteine-adding enzyme BshC, partial [Gemmatimonadales bacterium]
EALSRLRRPDALVVTTGQQPGLFTGPLYSVFKALSAAALARQLEARWSRPVVPVFWTAGDDHDFAEARSSHWLDASGELASASLPNRPEDAPLTPMSRLPLGREVAELLDSLEFSLPASPFRDETMAWLRRYYLPDATIGAAFSGAMAEFLERFGILTFDPTHLAAKQAMAPLLLRALEQAASLESALVEHVGLLAAAGRPAPVPVGGGASLVFLDGAAGRDRLVAEAGGFLSRRAASRWSLAELEQIAAREPTRLSPNVLLRPVVESALLPTVAYVAGPGELAYLPMCEPLYWQLEVPPQRPVPRWSGLLIEARVDRVLTKFAASLSELLQPGQALESRVVRDQVPSGLHQAAARLRGAIDTEYAAILEAATGVDPTLERPVTSARRHAHTELADLEKRVHGHLKKRQATELAQIARARLAVQPGGKPQERVLGAPGWLARFGPALFDDVFAEIRRWCAEGLAGGPGAP